MELVWNYRAEGLHVFTIPYGAPTLQVPPVASSWFMDKSGAWWEDEFALADVSPTAAKIMDGDLPEDRVQAFETFPFAVQSLIAGDVDAVIIDEVAGLGYLGENAESLELVGPSISSDELGFIYPLDSDIVDLVDQALAAMKADGFLAKVNLNYFGPDFDVTYDDIGPGAYGDE